MKRYIVTLLVAIAAPLALSAQVTKQVEVTKNFAPEIGTAKKMEVAPNMVDTITLRPEIDYTITPRSFASALGTHRFQPAKVTYWEYRHQYPFYLKAGLGYPLNTVADFYATTHRADVGYLTGYINHYGQYGKLKYENAADGIFYNDNKSLQMANKVGVTGGKYFGRYTLSGDVFYRMDTYHRFPLHSDYDRRTVDFEDVNLAVSFGDSFANYSHFNFKVYASADFYNDKSQNLIVGEKYQQMNVTAGGAIAREITKRSALSLDVNYKGYYGMQSLKAYKNSLVGATLMYHYRSGGLVNMKVGAKVFYDYNPLDSEKTKRVHAFPYLSLSLNINDKGSFVPYIEVDGDVINNSYYSLVRKNPYVSMLPDDSGKFNVALQSGKALPNTELYNVRFGVSGHTANSKFAYRLYANMSFMNHALYWYNVNQIFFGVESAKRNIWSLCAAVEYKPISQLLVTAEVKGSLYTNFTQNLVADALPPIEAALSVRYTHKKFTVGATMDLYGTTKWTTSQSDKLFDEASTAAPVTKIVTVPAMADLGVYVDWRVGKSCTIFAEGNNLLNMPMYHWVFYRELGASFTAGVKVQF